MPTNEEIPPTSELRIQHNKLNITIKGQIMDIRIGKLNIHYEEAGSGKDVLFLHGWGSSCAVWRSVFEATKDLGHLVAPDFPGCGQSDTMEEPWDIDDYADFVLEFIEKTKLENPILIGHSHGGRVIMKLCGEKKLSPPKIIFVDAAGLIPKKTLRQKIKAKSFKAIKGALSLPVIKNYSAGLLDKARNHFGSADYNAAPPVLRQTLVSLVNTDLRHLLPNIECPSLLIWGDKDTSTPIEDAKTIESLIKDSGLCIIKDTGHFSFCEKPYEANAIIRSFLS